MNPDEKQRFPPIACWWGPAESERHLDRVRRFSEAMRPFTTGAVYLNFEPDGWKERVRAGYGAQKHAKQLVELEDKWDLENLFRVNQNIKPRRWGGGASLERYLE